MKTWLFLLMLLVGTSLYGQIPPYNAPGPDIVDAEYFFDADPGFGNGTAISITPGNDVTLNFDINVNALTDGAHILVIRAQDADGTWSLMQNKVFFKGSSSIANLFPTYQSPGPDISEIEYFFDHDPGEGAGTPLAVTPGPDVTYSGFIDVQSLGAGLHILAVRAKDSNETWSLIQYKAFFKGASDISSLFPAYQSPGPDITEVEYFFDHDPGEGAGTPLAIASGQDALFSGPIDVQSLGAGLHILAVRAKDSDGTWSLMQYKAFFKGSNDISNLFDGYQSPGPDITEVEYFFDHDPGEGLGTPLSIASGQDVLFSGPIDVQSLGAGLHILAVRAKDSDGTWSLIQYKAFFKGASNISSLFPTYQSPGADIVEIEYFIDDDPGFGNGRKWEVTPGQDISILDDPCINDLQAGDHQLNVRVKDVDGRWSLIQEETFTIQSGCNIYLDEAIAICDDNGTPNNFGDDFYTFELFVSMTDASTSYEISGDLTGSGTASCDTSTTFDNNGAGFPYGGSDFNITLQETGNANCNLTTTIPAPLPEAVQCQNATVVLDVNGQDSITPTDVILTNLCGIQSIVLSQQTFTCSDLGPQIITVTQTDIVGTVTTCTSSVMVVDTLPPMVITQDITVNLDANGQATITVTDIDNGSSDNCSIQNRSLNISSFDSNDVGNNTVILTVTDLNGIQDSASAVVTVLNGGVSLPDIEISGAPNNPEGNTGTTDFTFTLNRTGDSTNISSVDFTVAGSGNNPANADDFGGSFPMGTIQFDPNQTTQTITIQVTGDIVNETDENFTVTISNPTNGNIINASATGTIINDDLPPPDISILGSPSNNEGNSGTTDFTFTLNRTGDSTNISSVDFTVAGLGNNPANADDFGGSFPMGTIQFDPNQTTQTITIQVTGDIVNETDENFTVTISNPTNGNIINASATGTIINDDLPPPDISILGSPSNNEGNSGTTNFTFNIIRIGDLTNPSSVDLAVLGVGVNPANADDFGGTFPMGSIQFNANQANQTVTIQVTGDTDIESDEIFGVFLSNPVNGNITGSSATGTILNDDVSPDIAISGSPANNEGNAGTTNFIFTVTRTGDLTNPSSVDFNVMGTGSNPTDPADFGGSFPMGSIQFNANQVTQTVIIQATGDTDNELDEDFTVTISNPTNGNIIGATATGTILNDDLPPPDISISGSPSNNEGNSGLTNFTFSVTRTGDLANPSSVDFNVTGTGANPTDAADFGGSFPMGSIQFNANQATQTIIIQVTGDTDNELDEDFTVTISNPTNGNIIGATATGTILNDDLPPPDISISGSPSNNEGNSGLTNFTFSVTRTGDLVNPSSVDFNVAGTGANPADATDFGGNFPMGSIQFNTNQATQTVIIQVTGDMDGESDENFTVSISNPTNGNILNAIATGTILNDDAQPPSLSISGSPTNNEGNSGLTNFTFSVTRTGDLANPSSVDFNVTGTGANPTDAADFGGSFPMGSIQFNANQATQTIIIQATGDINGESDEDFSVALSNPVNGSVINAIATGTILNDDAPSPNISISGSPINNEGNNANETDFIFTITRTGNLSQRSIVYYTVTGTSTNPVDASDFGGSFPTDFILFDPGAEVQDIIIRVWGDNTEESDEDFQVNLSNPANGTIINPTAIGTIINDDSPLPNISISGSPSNSEGNSGTANFMFTITRTGNLAVTSSVILSVVGTGNYPTNPVDFNEEALSFCLSFPPGLASDLFPISVFGDTEFEPDETFMVSISNPVNCNIITPTATGTIINDDQSPTPQLISGFYQTIAEDRDGNLWGGTSGTGLSIENSGIFQPDLTSHFVRDLEVDTAGNVWVASARFGLPAQNGGIRRYNSNTPGDYEFFTTFSGLPTRYVNDIIIDENNMVFAAHGKHSNGSTIFQGAVSVGVPSGGSHIWTSYTAGLPADRNVLRVTRRDDKLWAFVDRSCPGCQPPKVVSYTVSNTGALSFNGNVLIPGINFTGNTTTPRIESMFTDSKNWTWLGFNRETDLAVYDGIQWDTVNLGTILNIDVSNLDLAISKNSISEDQCGAIWIPSNYGVFVFDGAFTDLQNDTFWTRIDILSTPSSPDLLINDVQMSDSITVATFSGLYTILQDSCIMDKDGDGLLDIEEDTNGNGMYEPLLGETDWKDPDSDNDGLLDLWEVKGFEYNGTNIKLHEDPYFAHPLKKDIFLEIDWMAFGNHTNHEPSTESLFRLWQAFKDAPVQNPDNTWGINVHIDAGTIQPPELDSFNIGLDGGEVDFVDMIWLDTPRSGVPTCTTGTNKKFSEYKNNPTYFKEWRKEIFHYAIFGHTICTSNEGVLGQAIINGSDIIVARDRIGNDQPILQAVTLMHELGHNLGLLHGGGDCINGKPNYRSIMSYHYAHTITDSLGEGLGLDFSRVKLNTINENELREIGGVGTFGFTRYSLASSPHCCTENYSDFRSLGKDIDWNGNGFIDPAPYPGNINNCVRQTPLGEELSGFNDWENIKLGGFRNSNAENLEKSIETLTYQDVLSINLSPHSVAGKDMVIAGDSPEVTFRLDGSGSFDSDGLDSDIRYQWLGDFAGTDTLKGVQPLATLAKGLHEIILYASDELATSDPDTIQIEVIDCPIGNHLFVDPLGIPNAPGTSWTQAIGSLINALNICEGCPNITELWLKKGTYVPDSTLSNCTFSIPSDVTIYGGFAGNETAVDQRDFLLNHTVLSGEIGDPNSINDNAYHVITIPDSTSNSILDGLIINGGNANGIRLSQQAGAGIYSEGAVEIRNCTIENCQALLHGAALYNMAPLGNIKMSNTTIINSNLQDGPLLNEQGAQLELDDDVDIK